MTVLPSNLLLRNAVLTLYTSNRLENLADRLSEVLKTRLPSPLTPEIVLVQSQGMEK